MKRKIRLQENVTVLTATNKRVEQFDRLILNSASNIIRNVLFRIGNFFKKDPKVVPMNYQYVESNAMLAPTIGEKLAGEIPQNAPDEAIRKENVKVISADGTHVGNLERVFTESAFDQITHLLISREIPVKERNLIPIKWVQTMD